MNIEFTARRVKLAEGVREIVEKKLAKLEKVVPRDAQAHVIVRAEKKSVSVEVTVTSGQRVWTATETGDDQLTVTHLVMDHIALQAKKAKSRVREEKKHRASPVKTDWEPQPEKQARRAPKNSGQAAREMGGLRPPRRENITAVPMFEEDALDKFSAGTRDVLVYRDPADETFRVLYRRRDGSLGVLIPS